jgi:hypothetical protein
VTHDSGRSTLARAAVRERDDRAATLEIVPLSDRAPGEVRILEPINFAADAAGAAIRAGSGQESAEVEQPATHGGLAE